MFSWEIDPNSEKFRRWLQWLVDEKQWSADAIIEAVFESHKHQKLQKEYLKWEEEQNG